MNITLISYILGGSNYIGSGCYDGSVEGMLQVTRHDDAEKVSLLMFRQDICENDPEYQFEYQIIDNDEPFDQTIDYTDITDAIWTKYNTMLKDYTLAWVEQRKYEESERKRKAIINKKAREKRLVAKELKKLAELKEKYEPKGSVA